MPNSVGLESKLFKDRLRHSTLQGVVILILSLLLSRYIHAQAENPHKRYEKEISLKALEQHGWILDEQPEHKKIRSIHTLRLPVFIDKEGGILATLNYVHVTTRSKIILRESRLNEGSTYRASDALETERNLRATGLFTFVQIFAVQPKTLESTQSAQTIVSSEIQNHDKIDLVIITRDLWSLRLESSFEYIGEGINSLNLSLTERNLMGQRQSLSVQTSLSPFSVSTGISLADPRFGPDLSAGFSAGFIWGKQSGAREGKYAGLNLGRPLYHQDQTWSLTASAQAIERLSRLTKGSEVLVDEPVLPGEMARPIEWETKSYSFSIGTTRQWSGSVQQRVAVSLGGDITERVLPNTLSKERAERWRQAYLAPDRTQFGPSITYRAYTRKFTALSHVSTFGLSEDLQLGGSFSSSLGLSFLGDQAVFPGLQGLWTETWGGKGSHAGFWRLSLGGGIRIQPPQVSSFQTWSWVNRSMQVQFIGTTPLWSWLHGRMVWSSYFGGLWEDINRSVVSLGGSQALRGYAAQALYAQSAHIARINLEYRSAPLAWHFVHLGWALFYDAGAVGRDQNDLQAGQSTGIGLRLLFPQLNRSVFRFDLASPIHAMDQPQFSVTSSQAFAIMPWEVIL